MYKFSPLFIHSNSQQIKGTRARAKSLSLSFFLSSSKTDDDCVILRVVSLSCVFSNDDRVFSERFLNSRTVVFYPILSNFASEPTRSREKTKILHSPLIEHGRRRDQSNELDHPVVAPRSVHGVSDAGAPMMQSSSSSLSSCVRNVFLALFFEKSKSPFEKAFLRKKCLEATPTGRFLSNQRFFSFFFLSFFPQRRREKNDKKKKQREEEEDLSRRKNVRRFSFCLSLSRNVFVTQKNDTLYSKILSLIKRLCIKTGWIRAPRSRFGPREKHEKHPD